MSILGKVSQEIIDNRPLYPIGIVAGLLKIHPQTIRVWERYGVVQPQRISGKRFYSNNDLSRLRFVLTVPKDESVWSSKPDLAETGIDKGLDRQELDAYSVFWERVSDVLNE